jgi:hypothetical protein
VRFKTRPLRRKTHWGIHALAAIDGYVHRIYGIFPARCVQGCKVSHLNGFEYFVTLSAGETSPMCGKRAF